MRKRLLTKKKRDVYPLRSPVNFFFGVDMVSLSEYHHTKVGFSLSVQDYQKKFISLIYWRSCWFYSFCDNIKVHYLAFLWSLLRLICSLNYIKQLSHTITPTNTGFVSQDYMKWAIMRVRREITFQNMPHGNETPLRWFWPVPTSRQERQKTAIARLQ